MKREDIENAGRIEREKVIKELQDGYNKHHDINLYTAASATIGQYALSLFVAGAKWRINSVWHDIKEMPENNRMILIIMQHDIPTVIGPDNTFFREEIKDRHIQRWAYVEDLKPNMED